MAEQVIGNTPQISDYLLTDDYNVNSSQIGASSACVKTAVNDMNASLDSMANVIGANIGSIITLICSNTYVPLGTLPLDGSEYSADLFQNFYTNFLITGRLLTCTYAEYTAQVAITGNCGKFALDTVNGKFKTPLMKDGDSITQASSAAELGKSVKAGLPNITFDAPSYTTGGVTGFFTDAVTPTGAAKKGIARTTYLGAYAGTSYDLAFDASLASPVYGNSTTVTDEQIRLRHFVVVASAQNNASVFDWSNYMAGLAGKANLDMDNLTQVGTTVIAHCAMPSSDRIINVTLQANGSQSIPAPADGFFRMHGAATGAGQTLGLWGSTWDVKSSGASGNSLACSVPVRKGETVIVSYSIPVVAAFQFVYIQGAY